MYDASLPQVSNSDPTNITTGSAFMNGTLISTGSSPTRVYVLWGTNDASTNITSWANTNTFGTNTQTCPVPYSTNITTLNPNTLYYYRYYATNDSGEAWATSSKMFINGGVGIQTTVGASEIGLTPGTFTVYRATSATNVALTLNYAQTGTAVPSTDFVALTGSVTIPAGSTSAPIVVTPLRDWANPNNTTLSVTLTAGTPLCLFDASSNALMTVTSTVAGLWYVATNGASPWDGSSWARAFTNVQQALDAATDGDRIYIAGHTFSSNTTVQLNSQLVWTNKTLTILGGFAADGGTPGALGNTPTVLTQPAAGTSRILYINAVTNGILQNLAVMGGNLTAVAYGGGVMVTNCVNLTMKACTVISNTVNGLLNASGGGLYVTNSSLVLTNCVVEKNLIVGANQGKSYGGGIYLASGMLSLSDTVMDANKAQYGTNPNGQSRGGGLYVNAGTGTLVNCLLYNNDAGYLYSHDSSGVAPDVIVTGYGDAIYVNGGLLQVSSTTIACHPDDGIYQFGGTVTVTNSILWNNFDDLVGVPAANLACSDIETGDNNGTNGCLSVNPLFEYGFYLGTNSPCINTGSVTAVAAGLDGRTSRVDGSLDTNAKVNLGYHYATGFDLTYAEVYVATNGADSGGGTNALQPFATLTKAFSMMRNGTRIHVAAGNYTTNGTAFPLTVANQIGFQLLGAGSTQTMINAAGANQRVLALNYVGGVCRLEGLTFQGGRQTVESPGQAGWAGTQGGGLWINNCSDVTLSGCNLTNNAAAPSSNKSYGGAMYIYGSRVALTNCLVKKNTCTGGSQASAFGGGIYFLGHTLAARDTVFDGNTVTYGVSANGGQYAAGGSLYTAFGMVSLVNCLLNGNDALATAYPANAHGDGVYARSGGAGASSCTIAGNLGEGIYCSNATVVVTNSILWDNVDDLANVLAANLSYCDSQNGDNNGANGCFSTDPLFTGGYYLDPGSPCVDTGSVTAVTAGLSGRSTRLDGTPDAGILDLGYHYAGAVAGVVYSDLYVAPAPVGNDSYSGTNALESLATLTHALALAGSATRVHIASGTYSTNSAETFPLTISLKSGVKLLGTNQATTVINASGSNQRVLTLDRVSGSCRIEGLSLRGGNSSANEGGGVWVNGCSDVTLAGCGIVSNRVAPAGLGAYGGGLYAISSAVTLTNCLVERNTVVGGNQNQGYGGGISFMGTTLTVRDSVIDANQAVAGSNGSWNAYGGGLYVGGGSAVLMNSLLYRNDCVSTNFQGQAAYQYGDGVYVGGGVLQILSSTIVTNLGQGINRGSGAVTVTNSIVWNNGIDVTGTVSLAYCDFGVADTNAITNACISVDPCFNYAATNDYRIQDRSPCINLGSTQGWMTNSLDLAGTPRILDGVVDIGAYETALPCGTVFRLR